MQSALLPCGHPRRCTRPGGNKALNRGQQMSCNGCSDQPCLNEMSRVSMCRSNLILLDSLLEPFRYLQKIIITLRVGYKDVGQKSKRGTKQLLALDGPCQPNSKILETRLAHEQESSLQNLHIIWRLRLHLDLTLIGVCRSRIF